MMSDKSLLITPDGEAFVGEVHYDINCELRFFPDEESGR